MIKVALFYQPSNWPQAPKLVRFEVELESEIQVQTRYLPQDSIRWHGNGSFVLCDRSRD